MRKNNKRQETNQEIKWEEKQTHMKNSEWRKAIKIAYNT